MAAEERRESVGRENKTNLPVHNGANLSNLSSKTTDIEQGKLKKIIKKIYEQIVEAVRNDDTIKLFELLEDQDNLDFLWDVGKECCLYLGAD